MNVNNSEEGYTLLGALISIGLFSGLMLLQTQMTKSSRRISKMIKEKSEIMDLQYYVNQNFSCKETLKNVKCNPISEKKIDSLRESGEILTDSQGTIFNRLVSKKSTNNYILNAKCTKEKFNFFYSKGDIKEKHLFNNIPIVCGGCREGVDTITFEEFNDGDSFPNDYFKKDFGITFSPSVPVKVTKNGTLDPVIEGQHAYECGKCGSKSSGKRFNGVRNDEDHEVGKFFITDDSNALSVSLDILYDEYVTEASGIILDLDPGEYWTVKAYDGASEVYSYTYSGSSQYDGAPLKWSIENDPEIPFNRVVLIGQDGVGPIGNFGLAFDNFSPSRVCENFYLP